MNNKKFNLLYILLYLCLNNIGLSKILILKMSILVNFFGYL